MRADPFDSEENGWPGRTGKTSYELSTGELVAHEEVPMRAAPRLDESLVHQRRGGRGLAERFVPGAVAGPFGAPPKVVSKRERPGRGSAGNPSQVAMSISSGCSSAGSRRSKSASVSPTPVAAGARMPCARTACRGIADSTPGVTGAHVSVPEPGSS